MKRKCKQFVGTTQYEAIPFICHFIDKLCIKQIILQEFVFLSLSLN
jgi:hypothetical protein